MQPEPIIVTQDELVGGLTRWRQNEIDRISTEILLDEQLRQVAFAMAEPPVMRLPTWPAWLLACFLWAPAIIIAWEILRP